MKPRNAHEIESLIAFYRTLLRMIQEKPFTEQELPFIATAYETVVKNYISIDLTPDLFEVYLRNVWAEAHNEDIAPNLAPRLFELVENDLRPYLISKPDVVKLYEDFRKVLLRK